MFKSTHSWLRLNALAIALVLLIGGMIPLAHAAGQSISIADGSAGVTSAQTITFPLDSLLANGDTIALTYPVEFTGLGTLRQRDVSASQSDATFSEATFSVADNTIEIATLVAGTGDLVIEVEGLTNPLVEGQYSIYSVIRGASGVLKESGSVLASVGNTVSVRAAITEVLIAKLSSEVSEIADFGQKITMLVRTNAYSGYSVQARSTGSEKADCLIATGESANNTIKLSNIPTTLQLHTGAAESGQSVSQQALTIYSELDSSCQITFIAVPTF